MLTLAAAAGAQVGVNYSFAQTVGTYTPITGGTVLGVASTANSMDDAVFAVSLPFTFTFDGAGQTSVYVSTNGFLSFGATNPGTTNYGPLSSTTAYSGAVSPFGRDLQGGFVFKGDRTLGSNQILNVSSTGPIQIGDGIAGTGIPAGTTIAAIVGNTITMSANATSTSTATAVAAYGPWSEMRYEAQGTSPNQVFIAQWSGWKRFSTSTLTTVQDMTLNFQIRLYEANGTIEVVYGNCSPGLTTLTTVNQVGLRGPNNTFPANINNRKNVKGTNDDWSLSVPGTTNAEGMVFNNVAPANVIPNGLTYSWTLPAGIPATTTNYGAGCYTLPRASFYQLFADAAAASPALSGQSMVLTPTGSEYLASWGGGTYVTPSGTAGTLAVGDDGEVSQALSTGFPTPAGPVTNIRVHGNGVITMGATAQTFPGTNSFTPTAAGFLAAGQTAFWSWHDFNSSESGSGAVKYEEALDGNNDLIAYITWDGVENYPTGLVNPSTIQFQLTLTGPSAGRATYVWVNVDSDITSTFGTAHLVGYSPGGANLDPGSVSLATALPIVTAPDVAALALAAGSNAVLGTTVVYTTSNLPLTTVVTAQIVSLIPIPAGTTIPGAPGCLQYVDLSLSATTLLFGSPTTTFSFAVPNNPGLAGLPLNLQSASYVPGVNPLNVLTSNGVQSVVGNF